MSSQVADPVVAEAFDALSASLGRVVACGLEPADVLDGYQVVRELEVLERRTRALQVQLLAQIDRSGLHKADGHASAKVMVRHAANLSNGEASRRAKAAAVLRDMPQVAAGFAGGVIGSCQVSRIAQVHANSRVRDELISVDAHIAVLAARLPYREFDDKLTDWERLADEDGAGARAERNHEQRNFRIGRNLDGGRTFDGGCGSLQGAEIDEIFEHFVQAGWLADWAEARERLGDTATASDLVRTESQRRMDAFHAMCLAAAAHAGEAGSTIVTNLALDLESFERQLRRLCDQDLDRDERLDTFFDDTIDDLADQPDRGTTAEPKPAASDAEASARSSHIPFRCHTINGDPIDPTEATVAALVGRVRRVVFRSDGVVIDQGRATRLFKGSARLAVMLSNTTCYWPGCQTPVTHCQADHLERWNGPNEGCTNPGNGGPACGKHNRFKERGFTVHRDARGTWHTYRPDGSEII